MHASSLSLLLLIFGISSPISSSAAGIYNRDEASDRHDKIQAAALAFAGYDRHHGARQPQPLRQDEDSPQPQQEEQLPSLDDTLFCTTHRHLHLAVGHDPSTSMTVSFSSEPCDYGHSPPPKAGVMIGTTPHRLDRLVLEQSHPKRYNATLKVHKGTVHERLELYESEWQRHVTVTGLRPDTTYYYRPVILKAGGGSLAAGLRPDLREDKDANEDANSEFDLLYQQEQEEIARDGGEEEDQRQRRALEQLFRLAEEMEEAEIDSKGSLRIPTGTQASLRATFEVAPPPAYKSHPYVYQYMYDRDLHMSPKQTAKYVEEQIARVGEHKIAKGVLESNGAPSFRTAPPANVDAHLAYHHPISASPIKFAIIGDVAQTKPALLPESTPRIVM